MTLKILVGAPGVLKTLADKVNARAAVSDIPSSFASSFTDMKVTAVQRIKVRRLEDFYGSGTCDRYVGVHVIVAAGIKMAWVHE